MTKTLTLMCAVCLFAAVKVQAQKKADETTIKKWVAGNATALGFSAADVNNTRIASFYYDKFASVTMAYLQQTYKGVDIYNALTTVAFKDGKAISVTSSRIADAENLITNQTAKPSVAPAEALRNAASNVNLSLVGVAIPLRQTPDGQEFEYDRLGIGFNNIIVRLMWTNTEDDAHLKLSWQVSIHALKSNDYWLVKVDALKGSILRKENLKVECKWTPLHTPVMQCYEYRDYKMDNANGEKDIKSISSSKFRVIPYPYSDPDHVSATLVSDPWSVFTNTDATTLKWNNDGGDYDSTRGNNVLAQEDGNGNDGLGKGGHSKSVLPDLDFDYMPDYVNAPGDSLNQGFALTNLFYWNNMNHDMEYQYGFDEVSGNFQANNLTRGGKENDYVNADAQDGSGTDNANFSTPPDGQKPRMQMYLFNHSSCYVNQPLSFSGFQYATEGQVSKNNTLAKKGPITGDVVLYNDDALGTTHQACVAAANAGALNGKIALIQRGNCAFTSKILNAQNAGAIAVVVADNVPGEFPIIMGGTDNTITIPAVMVSYETGDTLIQFLSQSITVNVTLNGGLTLDGDLDNGVISHEFFHGVSNRLTGGANNVSCLQNKEQMGEGWSDYNALMMTTDWSTAKATDGANARPLGNYVMGWPTNFPGIRNYPYSTDFSINPWTYDSMKLSSRFSNSLLSYDSHIVGEVWCAMLWDMTWEIIKTDGINKTFWDASKPGGNTVAMSLVMEGMKLQKCSPGFVDGRDGILKADTLLYGGKYSRAIWTAFARRGLGYSADEGSTGNIKDGVAAYDVPLVLPVVWGNFTAEKVNSTALLKWTTVSEQNTDKFVIERTFDGHNYTEIGSVKAAGYSATTKSYTFTDARPVKGTNSYRIRMVDNDGAFKNSDVRSLSFDEIKNIISVAPNPARDKVAITVRGNTKNLQVKLYNNIGQQVGSYILNGETLTLNVSQFTRGSYYVSVTGDGINQKEKLVIQ